MSLSKQLISSYIKQSVDESWFELLNSFENLHKAIQDMVNVIGTGVSMEPDIADVLNAFKYCKLTNLKVVMLGQDPYYQPKVATGLAFANKDGITSPSLEIINEELEGKLEDSTLVSWAEQGVLLLNSALTVETGEVGTHYYIWEQFIIDLFKELSKMDLIWVLIGSKAQTFQFCTTGITVKTYHPAYDIRTGGRHFRGSGVFVRLDQELLKRGLNIKWTEKVLINQ